jgi:membrane-bound serine protease (ClpP class)
LHRRYAHVALVIVLALSITYSVAWARPNDKVLLVDIDAAITGATTEMMEDAAGVASNIDARLILVTVDTPGGEINAVKDIMNLFEASSIPVCFYVYPPGSSAWSGGTYLLVSSHVAAMSSGTSIGSAQPVQLTGEPINDTKHINALSALMVNHAALHGRNKTAVRRFITENLNLGPEDALRYGVVELAADDVQTLLNRLSEKALMRTETEAGTSVWRLVDADEQVDEKIITRISFTGLDAAEVVVYAPSVQSWLLQLIYDPGVASILFTLGFYLFIIGLQTPGLGAEFVGALFLLLSLMAFQVIGVEPMSLILFTAGFIMVLAELKMHTGFLGFAGGLCILLGTFFLVPSPHWLLAPEATRRIRNTLLGVSLFFLVVFGALVYKVSKARSLKAATGEEAIISSRGFASTRLEPRGEVRVMGEHWRARAEDVPIDAGAEVEVTGREGLVLVVRAVKPKVQPEKGREVKQNV